MWWCCGGVWYSWVWVSIGGVVKWRKSGKNNIAELMHIGYEIIIIIIGKV